MINRKTCLCFILALIAAVMPLHVLAQAVSNASIHGTVQDSGGAVIPGAQIKATQTDTGRVQTTVSGSDGTYGLLNLAVGSYRIAVEAPNFKSYIQSGIILQVGTDVMINIVMDIGSVTEHVEVSADAAMVQTQDTSVSQVIDRRRIVELPLNGRQATDLILLSGGAAQPPNSSRVITTHDYATAVGISVSGGQINGNNYLLDGADHNDSHSNVNMPFPFPDALQEFSVQSSGISSRFGLHPGSVVNVVTKSGTNAIHGDLFEFVRNGDFNARNFFATAQDSLKRNQFGGTIGAPIIRNKIFLFSGFQATRERTAPPQSKAFVPTAAVLSGDFSVIDGASCQSTHQVKQLTNPATGLPYSNNFISPSTFNAPALALLKQIPASTDACGAITYALSNPNNENQYVGRADWTLSDKQTVFGRYFIDDYSNPAIDASKSLLNSTRSGLQQRAQSVVLGDQYIFTPNLLNAIHVGFVRLAVNRAQSPGMPSPTTLGVNMYNASNNYVDLAVSNYFSVGGSSNAPASFIRNQWQVADDIDLTKGRHHMSIGAEWITGQMDESNLQFANGEFNFNGSRSGDALADFLLGALNTVTDSNRFRADLRQKYLGAYFEEELQLNKRLNVHAGVRWEPSLPEHDARARGDHFSLSDFTAGNRTTVYNNAPPGLFFYGDKGIPKSYANGSYHDFAPRVGVAYDPTGTGQWSIRASYGIFFDTPESFTIRDFGLSAPWGNSIVLTAPSGGFSNPVVGITFPTPVPPTSSAAFPSQGQYVTLPLDLHHIYMEQYNLSLEHQISSNWLFSLDYVGNRGVHMRGATETNPATYIAGSSTTKNTSTRRKLYLLNPTTGAYYSNVTAMDDGVNTFYNGLRAKAEHRFANHFSAVSVYTFSKCLQTSETIANRVVVGGNTESNPNNPRADYGPCDFDLKHNWNNSFVIAGPRFANHLMNETAGGWQLAFLVNYHSGFPFSPTTGTDQSFSGIGLDRPDVVAGVNPYIKSGKTWVNPAAFVPNAAGTFGTTRSNSLRQAGYVDADATLGKHFAVHNEQGLDLRAEFFNILNHTNFMAPVATKSSATFGIVQAANPARIIQLAAKYTF
ncbi:MAG TPA: carboxypeptidase regulatory-like domain-containing protein [Terracidiphilus sp.]|nr:carboxypeptidase regulatory-like domain-containing protein [Terracidiphilus sp.]